MAMAAGEFYRCTDEDCGCEIQVMKAANGHEGTAPQCCCGEPMEPGRASANMGENAAGRMDEEYAEIQRRGIEKTDEKTRRNAKMTAGRSK